jgi:hypothetical protein
MVWETIERPGYFGKKRDEIFKQYDGKYGACNWKIMWNWNDKIIPQNIACLIYEDAYFADSFKREDLWKELITAAKDVYDHQESGIESGLDYSVQKGNATHLQDISIRRVILRRGWKFSGDKLVQIRSHSEYWGKNLSPGRVQFHMPELICSPHLEHWWDLNSIEDFYQSNKVLQVKK